MRHTLYRVLKTIISVQKFAAVNYSTFLTSIAQSTYTKTTTLLSVGAVITNLSDTTEKRNENDVQFLQDIRKACSKNDNALKELMDVLTSCITEISKEYQENTAKQIEIISRCTKLGPVGEHWDELTKYRVEATELRQELTKYELLVQKVGQMAYNQAVTSLLSGIEDAMDLLEVHFSNLEKTVDKLSKENYQWETKLLKANRDSILHDLKTKK
ncbi:hypothetical protein MML48_3g00016829 [Holotrichia oblita]|uniref:Uncharacterized protein n=1 Tax=Holotrichia oblita TaxID=644536 RepID=A0ACB9TGA9_HOLOL|nr:hypothetical protein MML48_3g00016829 [Holotrichia oblita]